MTIRRALSVALVAALLLGAGACASDDDSASPSTTVGSGGVLNPPAVRSGTEWYLLYLTSLEDPAAKVQPFTTADRKVFDAVGTAIGAYCDAADGTSARTGEALVDQIVAATATVLGEAAATEARGPLVENQQLLVDAAETTCATP